MSISAKIERLLSRFPELEEKLADPRVFEDQKIYKALAQEHSYISEVKSVYERQLSLEKQLEENRALLKGERDEELVALLKEEITKLEQELPLVNISLETLLVPPDPEDSRGVIMELRAGTGGDEAAIFVGDVVRMYDLYATIKGWKVELLSCSPSEMGGFKEYMMALSGLNVKRLLQYEAGTHRVQRVPKTETQGRIHTSAITIAVMLEPGPEEEIRIDEKDLRIDTYRASGAGGQHVNVTDSAVRITHIPTGVVVYCQEERSQHKNKDKAMRLLTAKLADEKRVKREQEEAAVRSEQIGSGDRSERIRTYNFPQNRVTDHRIGLTLYNLDRVMQGEIDPITNALVTHYYQQKLST